MIESILKALKTFASFAVLYFFNIPTHNYSNFSSDFECKTALGDKAVALAYTYFVPCDSVSTFFLIRESRRHFVPRFHKEIARFL